MLKAILIILIVFEMLWILLPVIFGVISILIAILLELWWIPFGLLLLSYILKKIK